jgi:hypothetical protein
VTELIRDEFPKRISYMPIVPYAVSLSLSVMYRKMRYSQIPMFRQRGRRAFIANTALLKELGETFWCAKTMAVMAEQVTQEMDKAAAFIVQESGSGENSVREGSDPQPDFPSQPLGGIPRGFPLNPMTPSMNDMSMVDALPDIDLWTHIDPNFNINAVDAAIQGNLDFGTSANWFDWHKTWGPMESGLQDS